MPTPIPVAPPPNWTDVFTAFGTVGATAVAVFLLFREVIVHWIWHPQLEVRLLRRPPDCHIIQEVVQVAYPGEPPTSFTRDTFYCRLQVDNVGKRRALEVEVRISRVWRLNEDGQYEEDRDFLPMNLRWANLVAGLAVPVIDPHLPRHCNLCMFPKSSVPGEPAGPMIQFLTEVRPFKVGPDRWPTFKPPGSYRVEIAVTADNAKPIRKCVDIRFTGEWFDDSVGLAEKALRIAVTSTKGVEQGPVAPQD
jgi:hypothetical protein